MSKTAEEFEQEKINLLNRLVYAAENEEKLKWDENDKIDFISEMINKGSFRKKGIRYEKGTPVDTVLEDIYFNRGVSMAVENDTLVLTTEENNVIRGESAAVNMIEQLRAVKAKLDRRGTTVNDSPEFRKMSAALNKLMPKLDHVQNCDQLQREMQELAVRADDYYYAKLDQKHNGRRADRFDCAREIKEMMRCLEKHMPYRNPEDRTPEEIKSRLMTDVALKSYKVHEIRNTEKIGDKQERDAVLETIRSDSDYRKNFYLNAGKIIKGDVQGVESGKVDYLRVQLAVQDKSIEELKAIRSADKDGLIIAISAPARTAAVQKSRQAGEKQIDEPEYKVPSLKAPSLNGPSL